MFRQRRATVSEVMRNRLVSLKTTCKRGENTGANRKSPGTREATSNTSGGEWMGLKGWQAITSPQRQIGKEPNLVAGTAPICRENGSVCDRHSSQI